MRHIFLSREISQTEHLALSSLCSSPPSLSSRFRMRVRPAIVTTGNAITRAKGEATRLPHMFKSTPLSRLNLARPRFTTMRAFAFRRVQPRVPRETYIVIQRCRSTNRNFPFFFPLLIIECVRIEGRSARAHAGEESESARAGSKISRISLMLILIQS